MREFVAFLLILFSFLLSGSACGPTENTHPERSPGDTVAVKNDLPKSLDKMIRDLAAKTPDLSNMERYLSTVYFDLVKAWINHKGTSNTVDISATGEAGWLVTYTTIRRDGWEITVDHSERIYFNTGENREHFGNILKEGDKVTTEITYGLGRELTTEEKEEDDRKAKILLAEYNSLIEEILGTSGDE